MDCFHIAECQRRKMNSNEKENSNAFTFDGTLLFFLLPVSFCFTGIQMGVFHFVSSRAGFREVAGGRF